MSIFYFRVCDGQNPPDSDGFEMDDAEAAHAEAVKAAGDMLKETLGRPSLTIDWAMTVEDERGNVVSEICFSAKRA